MSEEKQHETEATHAAAPVVEKLPLMEKIGYGMGAMAENNMQNSLPQMTMPIMNILMGVDPVWITSVMSLTRVFDSVTDPLMGYISDNTNTRWGRRKPYLFIGALMAAIAFVAVWFFPISGWSKIAYCAYFFVASLVYFSFTTMYCVPYISLGYEISEDYNERTQLMAFRMFFVSIGNILVPWMFWFTQRDIFPNQLEGMRWTAALMGCVFIFASLGPLLFARSKRKVAPGMEKPRQKVRIVDIFSVIMVKPFLAIIGCLGVGVCGVISVGGLGMYITIYYVCGGSVEQGAYLTGICGTVSGFVSVGLLPVITWLSQKFGKRNALAGLLLFSGFGALLSWYLYNPEYPYGCVAVSVMLAPALTAIWMLLMSMTADVCEYDDWKNNLRREGVMAAVFSWTGKVGITLGILCSGYVLKYSGYVQELGANQTPEALMNMRVLFAGGTCVGLVLATLILFCYPLSEKRVNEIKREIQLRNEAASKAEN